MNDNFISPDTCIKQALKKIDASTVKVLFVLDKNKKLVGTLSDGDVRRHILKGKPIDGPIASLYNTSPVVLPANDYTIKKAKKLMVDNKIEVIPVVSEDNRIVDTIIWNKYFPEEREVSEIDIPVVVMAGGKGTRLAPFTDVFPKPLIPINNKPILEIIIDEFRKFGIKDYYLTLNYKGAMIKAYFEGKEEKSDYNIKFAWEKELNGTASSLQLLVDDLPDVFIVSNCDIIVKANYKAVLDFHTKTNSDLTIISSIQHHTIPYGVIEITNGGIVDRIVEKPEYTHTINTGVYILNKSCLDYIPDNTFFHMTHLIDKLIEDGQKVTTFPVNSNDYIDIGQWTEYHEAQEKFKNI